MLEGLKWFLFSRNRLPYFLNDSELIVEGNENYQKPDGTSAELKYAPDGWQDTLVKYARNIKYWGVFRDFTTPMKFVKDGARILRMAGYTYGFEAIVYLGIAKLDRFSMPYRYKSWYMSELNFPKMKESRTQVSIEALEGGISKYLKAFEGTTYQIPLDSYANAVPVEIDGMELQNSAQYLISDGLPNIDSSGLDENIFGDHLLDIAVVNKEISDIGGVFDVPRTKILPSDVSRNTLFFFQATADSHIDFAWDFIVHIAGGQFLAFYPDNAFIVIRSVSLTNVSTDLVVLHKTRLADDYLNGNLGSTYNVKGEGSMDLKNGDKLFFYAYVDNDRETAQNEIAWQYSGSEPTLSLKYSFRFTTTHSLAVTPKRLAELLLEKMTYDTLNNQPRAWYKVRSKFLDRISAQLLITSGDALREIPGAFISISFQDFFKAMKRYGLGLGIEGDYLVIEEWPYFFQDTVIADLGEVSDAEVEWAEDLLFNSLSLGYKSQEYKEINGKAEFNQGQKWTAPVTKVTAELDLQSPIRADAAGIELMRINFSQKKTTDTAGDNDSFFLSVTKANKGASYEANFVHDITGGDHMLLTNAAEALSKFAIGSTLNISGTSKNNGQYYIKGILQIFGTQDLVIYIGTGQVFNNESGVVADFEIVGYKLYRPVFDSISGVAVPGSVYNVLLSPKRSLLANGRYIRSCLPKLDLNVLVLQSADKNKNLSTSLNGVVITENDSVQISTLGAPLFQPTYINFKAKTIFNLLEQIASNPYGKIKWTVDGVPFYGFLMDGGIKPATADVQTFKLLSAPENNHLLMYPQ